MDVYVVSIRIIVFLHFASGSNILRCSSHFDLCGSGVVELASRALSEGSQQIEFPWVVLQKLQVVGVLSCEDPGHEGPRSLFLRAWMIWMNMEETQKWWG